MENNIPLLNEWPVQGLETIAACPVCGGFERSVEQPALTDRIFFCAPGVWTLYRCGQCRSGYLSPRPTPETIGLAYAEYYTHGIAEAEIFLSSSTGLGRYFPALRNGYLNQRFPRLSLTPSYSLGAAVVPWFKNAYVFAERDVRHLPTPVEGAKLLDIGSGGGEFVRRAIKLGYMAEGLEFDAQAVAAGLEQGLPILHGGLPDTGLPAASYDVVTLSQVIEHLHDPLAALAEIYRLLKPGGFFWLATPNMDAPGHAQFGADWRGLEPPRHLVLFSAQALASALERTGFVGIEFKSPGAVTEWFYNASYRISQNARPQTVMELPPSLKNQAHQSDSLALNDPRVGEELIVVAYK